jgi:hypothetical protein
MVGPSAHTCIVAAASAATAGGLLAGCALLGHAVLPRRLRPPRAAHLLLVELSLGSLAAGWVAWVAGSLFGTRAIVPIEAVLLLGALLRARGFIATSRRAVRYLAGLGRANLLLVALLAALLLCLVPQLLLPPVDSDGLRYHLALPRLYLLTGHVAFLPHDLGSGFPQTAEMLYLIGLEIAGGQVAKFLHFGYFLAALVALAATLHRSRRTRATAVLAPILVAASPVALIAAAAAFVDHTALFHLSVALLLFSRRAHPAATGAALGGALATKLTTGPVVVVVAVVDALRAPAGRRWRTAAALTVPVLLAVGPFALRNAIATGDPIFPVGHVLVGAPIPGVSDAAVRFTTHYHGDIDAPLGIAWGPGLGHSPPDEVAGWHHLAGLFAVAVAVWVPQARVFLLPVLAYVPFGLFLHPPTRYLLPLLWGLAGLEALALTSTRLRLGLIWVGAAAALPAALLAGHLALTTFSPFDLILGRFDRDSFLRRTVPGYAAARFVAAQPPGGRVMALDFPAPFYLDRPWIAEGMLSDPPLALWLRQGDDAPALLARLQRDDVRYLLVTPGYGGGTARSLLPLARSPAALHAIAGLRARLVRLATVGGVDVYEVPHIAAHGTGPTRGAAEPKRLRLVHSAEGS